MERSEEEEAVKRGFTHYAVWPLRQGSRSVFGLYWVFLLHPIRYLLYYIYPFYPFFKTYIASLLKFEAHELFISVFLSPFSPA